MLRPAIALIHDAAPTDGRRLRSHESRRKIVEAMMALVRGGMLEPSAELVAERAGVGLRSVFRHFKDMEGLRREMSDIVEAELREIVERPLVGAGWTERLLDLIDRRTEAFERVMPYRRAGTVQTHRSLFLQANNARLNEVLRQMLRSVLPTHALEDVELVEALDAALSFESWIRLRHDQGLEAPRAKAILIRTALALLSGVD